MNIATVNTIYLMYILGALLAIFMLLAVYFSTKDGVKRKKK